MTEVVPDNRLRNRFLGLRDRIASVTAEVQAALEKDRPPDKIGSKVATLRKFLGISLKEMVVACRINEKTLSTSENDTKPNLKLLRECLGVLGGCVGDIQRCVNRAPDWLEIPVRGFARGKVGESQLLDPELRVVEYHGEARLAQRDSLVNWCRSEDPISIKSFQALGGMGKTRLGIELCLRMANLSERETPRPWVCGFLKACTFLEERQIWEPWNLADKNLLLVVDYAGAPANLEALKRLLPSLKQCPAPSRRVLLLDRTDRFLSELHRDKQCGAVLKEAVLQREFSSPQLAEAAPVREREALFKFAAACFKSALDSTEAVAEPPNLKSADFERVLLLHMAALLAIGASEPVRDRQSAILDAMLDRERRQWEHRLESRKLPGHLLNFVERACRMISMGGGADGLESALSLADRDSFFSQLSVDLKVGILELLADLYGWGDRYITALTPDLLAERLAGKRTKAPKAAPKPGAKRHGRSGSQPV